MGEKAIGSEEQGKEKPHEQPKDEPEAKKTRVRSSTPENAEGEINSSSPGETGTTPGTNG